MVLAEDATMHRSSNHPSSAGPTGVSTSITSDWTCPFCPLLCDDIAAGVNSDDSLSAPATDCPRLAGALALYGAADTHCKASVDGREADLDTALARAADILSQAHRPLFGGMATDIAGARSLYTLAARCGAIVDHLHGDALAASTLALQDRGAFFTTLSEVRARADLVIVFACRPSAHHPRFYARATGTAEGAPALTRTFRFVGCEADPAVDALDHAGATSLLAGRDLFDLLALWSALLEGRSVEALDDASGTARELAALVDEVNAARYTVFVYEPAALPGPHAALLIEALNRIIKAVNRTVRAGGLALGGADGALSASQTFTWLSGFPLRTRIAMPGRLAEAPLDYDPTRYRTDTLLANHEVDALLWVSSFGPQPLPDTLDPDVPAIVLGHAAMAAMVAGAATARRGPTVFIPVATPGIDIGGHLFRTDGTVVVPLSAARHAALPGVADIATRLAESVTNTTRSAP
ncbi:Formyltransferase/hydrolase complex Fhc subunit B [Paraburkholderia gardini]|uniref:Formyltransferase/hydrolase complex Fhc subunit B n=2 Tax=Paraburkholderia gardini TaxID=2823469 RepID=A0ABN7QJN4_9BURK|nr:Formyltransferase/hydrolase complex Fhc subunit B [Paraburkholderia gardini]